MKKNINHIDSLDSIRGLAAFSVVLLHCLLPLPYIYLMTKEGSINSLFSNNPSEILTFLFVYSPIHIFWDGGAAVILFFVLSGFVLSLPFFCGKKINYMQYIIKRFCRIYIPYILSLIISFLCIKIFKTQQSIPELSDNFNSLWQSPISLKIVIDHIFMIGGTAGPGANVWNGVIWTLVHELRISFILPFLILLLAKLNWKYTLSIPATIIIISGLLFTIPLSEFFSGLRNTVFYSTFFVMGILVAKYQNTFKNFYSHINTAKKSILMILALLLYNWEWTLGFYLSIDSSILNQLVSGIGAAFIIIITLSSRTLQTFFEKKPLIWLGKISFSLYLIHNSVILVFVYSLYNQVPIEIILFFIPIISIILAPVFYKYVEIPSITIGRKLSKIYSNNK